MIINSTIIPPNVPAVDADGYFSPEWWKFLLTLLNRTGGSGIQPDTLTAAEWAASSALANVNTGAISAERALRELAGLEAMPPMPLDSALRARMAEFEAMDRPVAPDALSARIAGLEAAEGQRTDNSLNARIAVLEDADRLPVDTSIWRRMDDIESAMPELRAPVPPTPFVLPTVEGWTAPTLTNGWVNYGSGFNPAGYFKDPWGVVHLRGLVKSGTMSAAIFTLPAGYHPAFNEKLVMSGGNAFGVIDLSAAGGEVIPVVGSNSFLSLDGLTFRAL